MDITKSSAEDTEAAVREAEGASAGFSRVMEGIVKHLGAHTHANTVFGEPVRQDGVTVIPVARVVGAFGAGAGAGGGERPASEEHGRGTGVGGGGGYMVSPVGLIEIRPEGTRFRAIEPPLGMWGDVADLVLFVARRGLLGLARALKRD